MDASSEAGSSGPAQTLAVVLAAGEGLRMRPHTADIPKALLDVAGVTLLDRQLTALAAVGVRAAVVVVGHGGRGVESLVEDGRRTRRWALDVEVVANQNYRTTGTAGSLRLALDHNKGASAQAVVVVEGDVLLDRRALDRLVLVGDGHRVRVLASRTRLDSSVIEAGPEGTVSAIVHRSDLPPDPLPAADRADFFNLSCYRFAMRPVELARILDAALSRAPAVNVERVIDGLCGAGTVGLAVVDAHWAIEIDTPADLDAARTAAHTAGGRGPA